MISTTLNSISSKMETKVDRTFRTHRRRGHYLLPNSYRPLRLLLLITLLAISIPSVHTQESVKSAPEIEPKSNNDGDTADSETETAASLFSSMDTNHDASLSLSEFTSNFSSLRQKIVALPLDSQKRLPKMEKEFWNGFSTSTMMIIATEIGDKTFFIAAVLSMRNSRYSVFAGSFLALVVMTVLSTMMGLILPSFLPKSYTHIIAGVLFFYFGIKLIYDSRSMKNQVSDELEEVEEELLATRKKEDGEEHKADHVEDADVDQSNSSSVQTGDIEANAGVGGGEDARPDTPTTSNTKSPSKHKHRHASAPPTASASPTPSKSIFFQAFLLTFLAEWGDRSQIATIALAADRDPYGVTFGACFGHGLCTGMAVVGGRMLASKISEKTVSFWGGFVFLGFGFHSLFIDS